MVRRAEREEQALANLRRALKGSAIKPVSVRLDTDGYHVVFRKDCARRNIEEAVLEDGPDSAAIRQLVQRVRRALGG